MTAEVSITVKGGPEYDAPWVVIKGSVDDVGQALAHFREAGYFGALKAATQEFKAAPVMVAQEGIQALTHAGPPAK